MGTPFEYVDLKLCLQYSKQHNVIDLYIFFKSVAAEHFSHEKLNIYQNIVLVCSFHSDMHHFIIVQAYTIWRQPGLKLCLRNLSYH